MHRFINGLSKNLLAFVRYGKNLLRNLRKITGGVRHGHFVLSSKVLFYQNNCNEASIWLFSLCTVFRREINAVFYPTLFSCEQDNALVFCSTCFVLVIPFMVLRRSYNLPTGKDSVN